MDDERRMAAAQIRRIGASRWQAADADRVELGLVAEVLGINTSERGGSGVPLRGPRLDSGQVLAAARAALGSDRERAFTAAMFFDALEAGGWSQGEDIPTAEIERIFGVEA